MSMVFSKNKEKRSRSSSSEANNSFVKNVTSRVSGLLPATITKWFSSSPSSSSNANGSTQTADVTDSSTEDEAPESPITTQPPSKRMRYSSPGNYHYSSETRSDCIPTNVDDMDLCTPYGNVQSPPGRTTFRRETNFVSTPLRSTDESSMDSTDKETTMFKSTISVSTAGPSVAPKRKSLFDPSNSTEASTRACAKTASNTPKDPKQPCFKPSLFGSPFYPGRTMYGGASSSYINQPNIKQRRNTLVNEASSSDNTISNSTKRIMDLLQHYSSPLNEAKRIPPYTRPSRSESLNNSVNSSSPYSKKVVSYKTQELYVPSIASILRLKQKSRLMDTTNVARQLLASHSSTSDYVPYSQREQTEKETTSSKLTTKVKSRLTRPKRGESSDAETELPTPVHLPSAVLQIDQNNLPKFSFGIPLTSDTLTPTPKVAVNKSPVAEPKKANTTFKITETPLSATKQTENIISLSKSKGNWQCPDCWVHNKPDVENCVCCGATKSKKVTEKSAKCSVCKLADIKSHGDKCALCENNSINNIDKVSVIKSTDSSQWKCDDCWVNNDENAEKCVCCGAKNPKKATTSKINVIPTEPVKLEIEWKCEDCWIKNKSNVDKCAACGAAKPGAKQTSAAPCTGFSFFNSPMTQSSDQLTKLVKTQTSKWECPSCLVRNDNTKTKCVCCESDKPGLVKEPEKKSFNFGMNVNTTFKFGIDTKIQEASTTKTNEIKTTIESKNVEESETNNNVLSKTPTFKFGLSVKKNEDLLSAAKTTEEKAADSTPKMNFSFGIPTSLPPSTTITPILGTSNKFTMPVSNKEEDKEKPQEVPTIEIPKTEEAPKPAANLFASPLASQPASQEKSPAISFFSQDKQATTSSSLMSSSITLEKKDPPSNHLAQAQPAATSIETSAKPTFTFGTGGGIKINPNLFATAATTTIAFGTPLQNTTNSASLFSNKEPVTTSTMSMFPKTDSSSTVSLFQKSDSPASTAAPPALGATAPMFSFGGGNQNAQQEKPKFNFTFGSNNKTETPSLFKAPTFGASNDNKFTLPAATGNSNALGGNGLSSGNALGSNVMSSGNGLPANSLGGGSEMSNNPLASGNSLPSGNALQTPSSGIFGAAIQKENMWSSSNNPSNNLFVSNATTNSLQKPAAFTFGSSTPFNANNNNTTPAFGSNTQSTPSVFGMANQNANTQPSLFASPVQNQPAANVFGSPQPAANPAPTLGMFGTPNVGATPTFGTPNPSIPSFEAPSLTPAPAPAFNFGAPPSTGVFGFGQQAQQAPQQQAGGVYSFGGAPPGAGPQVQFNMGSAPNTAVRRMRKAVRRIPPR
ncbi:nuclear pore complex protein Nup153 isoform X2 [Pectinophora gossypiella]|uniref:nuclear pore complex protein Nup153 isoform X2 n=1 Tax=Pectinophora gossypiella TaxID=13191 RepID=UPI00214DFCA6|nr:nuclear pore complex protein Nup153 isoform X2 [Pectinophora gossypiella]